MTEQQRTADTERRFCVRGQVELARVVRGVRVNAHDSMGARAITACDTVAPRVVVPGAALCGGERARGVKDGFDEVPNSAIMGT